MIDPARNYRELCRLADAPPDCPACGSKANQYRGEVLCWWCKTASRLANVTRHKYAGRVYRVQTWDRRAL